MRQFSQAAWDQLGEILTHQREVSHASELRPSIDFSFARAQELAELRRPERDHEPEKEA